MHALACRYALEPTEESLNNALLACLPMMIILGYFFLRDRESLLRTPRAMRQQIVQLRQARAAYLNSHHEEPSARQLAEALAWPLAQVLSVLAAQVASQPASLDQEDAEGFSLAQRLPFLEPGFEKTEQRTDLRRAFSCLSEKEKELLTYRYSHALSQRETARRMEMTQMQVSRMEKRILTALRKEMTEEP